VPQSNVIFAYLALAFVVFITMRGQLGVYAGFLLAPAGRVQGNITIKTLGQTADGSSAANAAIAGINDQSSNNQAGENFGKVAQLAAKFFI
jgi:hypothetical protein